MTSQPITLPIAQYRDDGEDFIQVETGGTFFSCDGDTLWNTPEEAVEAFVKAQYRHLSIAYYESDVALGDARFAS